MKYYLPAGNKGQLTNLCFYTKWSPVPKLKICLILQKQGNLAVFSSTGKLVCLGQHLGIQFRFYNVVNHTGKSCQRGRHLHNSAKDWTEVFSRAGAQWLWTAAELTMLCHLWGQLWHREFSWVLIRISQKTPSDSKIELGGIMKMFQFFPAICKGLMMLKQRMQGVFF